jgi:hypothetical protein
VEEVAMNTEGLFHLEFSEDGGIDVAFSEEFLSLSREAQLHTLEAFFSETVSKPCAQEVDRAAAEEEITILLAQSLLAKLKRGERIEKEAKLDISLEELMDPDGIWD